MRWSQWFSRGFILLLILSAAGLVLFGKRPTEYALPDGTPVRHRTVIHFWEKWSGEESRSMQRLVDKYNTTEGQRDGVFVDYLAVSQIHQKMLISVAGGDPPDMVGLWAAQIHPFAQFHAIEPLDELVQQGIVTSVLYKPYIWHVCAPGGRLYAVSSTPECMALFWNKDLFRAAGLDPEQPPRSIAELDAMAERLTQRNEHGELVRIGFLPNEPGWWDYAWGIYFGNTLYNEAEDTFNIHTPQQVLAYQWYQSYARRLGLGEVQTFTSGFGRFNSPLNAFISQQVAMEMQGPFFANFIAWNNPKLVGHYGVAPFPTATGQPGDAVLGDLDTWVIPRGARHKQEALKVLAFFTRQDNIEQLCSEHSKPSPLRNVSPAFFRQHPNPYIAVFDELMNKPNVTPIPPSPSWERIATELNNAAQRIWLDSSGQPVIESILAEKQALCDRYVQTQHHYARMRAAKNLE